MQDVKAVCGRTHQSLRNYGFQNNCINSFRLYVDLDKHFKIRFYFNKFENGWKITSQIFHSRLIKFLWLWYLWLNSHVRFTQLPSKTLFWLGNVFDTKVVYLKKISNFKPLLLWNLAAYNFSLPCLKFLSKQLLT